MIKSVFTLFGSFFSYIKPDYSQDIACKEEILILQALPASSFLGGSYFIVCNNIVILYFSLWEFPYFYM